MCVPDPIGIWTEVLVFEERGKSEYPEQNLWDEGREPTKNQSKYGFDAAIWSRGHISGRRVLSSLRYPCALALFKSSCNFHQLWGFYFHEVPGTGILIMHFGMFRWYQVSSLNFQFFSLSLLCTRHQPKNSHYTSVWWICMLKKTTPSAIHNPSTFFLFFLYSIHSTGLNPYYFFKVKTIY